MSSLERRQRRWLVMEIFQEEMRMFFNEATKQEYMM